MSSPDETPHQQSSWRWRLTIAVVVGAAVAVVAALGRANFLVVIVLFFVAALVGGAIYLIPIAVRAQQIRRMQALAPEQFVFTFQSNSVYQDAVLRLRADGTIDPETPSDSESPLSSGPRWASASSFSLRIWRGYTREPYFEIPWTKISAVVADSERRRSYSGGTGYTVFPGVSMVIVGGSHPVNMVLRFPAVQKYWHSQTAEVDRVIERLNSIRA